jgi:hypothetical protein
LTGATCAHPGGTLLAEFTANGASQPRVRKEDGSMNSIIYLVGLVVVIALILSFLGLR